MHRGVDNTRVEHLNFARCCARCWGNELGTSRSLSVQVGVDDIVAAILSSPSWTLPFALSYLYLQFKGSKCRENWLK